MGDLIVKSFAKSSPAREFDAGHSAAILFFTGVRYYRMEDAGLSPIVAIPSKTTVRAKHRTTPDQRRAAKLKREQRRKALA